MESRTIVFISVAVLTAALDAFTIGRALVRENGVERTIAWVLAILLFPLAGALAYLALASPSVKRTTRRKIRSAAEVRRIWEQAGAAERAVLTDPMERSVLQLAASLTGLPPSIGNAVEFLADDRDAFRQIERALERAERSIWAEYYIVANDETGRRFLDLLIERARDGLDVRFLYDGVGSLGIDARRVEELRSAGGHAAIFLPLNPLRRRWSVHLRNHRKNVVVDGRLGFTGGMNVGDEYSGRARFAGRRFFHDSHLLVRGPAVHDLALIFHEDWSFATDESLPLPAPPPPAEGGRCVVGIVPSGPDQIHNATGLTTFGSINAAFERLFLTSPYFMPDEPTVRSLIVASKRGVDVRVLVPDRCDVALVGFATRSYFRILLEAGVRIFRYRPSMLHAKTLVVDGKWGAVGSANVDIRSFRLNFELSALVFDAAFARRLEDRFLEDLASSTEVEPGRFGRRGVPAQVVDGAARLLSPLL